MEIKKLLRVNFIQEYVVVFKEDGFKGVLRKGARNILFFYVLSDNRCNVIHSYYLSGRVRFYLVKK